DVFHSPPLGSKKAIHVVERNLFRSWLVGMERIPFCTSKNLGNKASNGLRLISYYPISCLKKLRNSPEMPISSSAIYRTDEVGESPIPETWIPRTPYPAEALTIFPSRQCG